MKNIKIKLKSLKESKANVEEALIEELNKELEIIIDKQVECLIENDFFDEEHKEFLKETIENIYNSNLFEFFKYN